MLERECSENEEVGKLRNTKKPFNYGSVKAQTDSEVCELDGVGRKCIRRVL